ncbi:mechanosensitive ion channel [Streptococcus fryi]
MNTYFPDFLYPFLSFLPPVISFIFLVIVALIMASIARKLIVKGLTKLNLTAYLLKWGIVKEETAGSNMVKSIGQLGYFLVILFFLPSILSGLNVDAAYNPIATMFDKFFAFIPNLIAAGLILFIGVYFCNFVKTLVKGLLTNVNLDALYKKATKQDEVPFDTAKLIDVLASVVYVLIFIPILTLALETLGISSISAPIVLILNQVLGVIPSILVAVVLLVVGSFVAKLVSNLLENILETSGIDQYSKYLSFKGESSYKISTLIAQAVRAILMIFFFVQAISVLNLEVLNTIGTAVIAYLPSVISSVAILILAIVGGNLLATFLANITGSKVLSESVRYGILVFAIFMALDQLQFAQNIVNATFVIVLGAAAVAFALAFGLGGRDFAAKQLEKLDNKIEKK